MVPIGTKRVLKNVQTPDFRADDGNGEKPHWQMCVNIMVMTGIDKSARCRFHYERTLRCYPIVKGIEKIIEELSDLLN